jgi:hypothetical protein
MENKLELKEENNCFVFMNQTINDLTIEVMDKQIKGIFHLFIILLILLLIKS